ncbi:hypothetical protein [Lactococcus lactis]|uniref:hypothetical protein n=1 Tax=Lactococcus lactis TaxID=1358 RepID=UPI0022DFA637|nr:hypothetical protein [Lactococcus lactis]
METDFWNNFWMVVVGSLSLGTSIVAIVLAFRANKQTKKQIKISSNSIYLMKK